MTDDYANPPRLRADRERCRREPVKRWSSLPITEDRAREIVDLLTNHDSDHVTDALIELLCGVMPDPPHDTPNTLDERFAAGLAAVLRAFTYTTRAQNELGSYVVHLKCAKWG